MSNIFNEIKTKNRLFVLKESSHNETIFEQNLFDGKKWQVVTRDHIWSEIEHVISRVRRGSRDDKQWIRLRKQTTNWKSPKFTAVKTYSVISKHTNKLNAIRFSLYLS